MLIHALECKVRSLKCNITEADRDYIVRIHRWLEDSARNLKKFIFDGPIEDTPEGWRGYYQEMNRLRGFSIPLGYE